jgi:hypothetical protein
VGNLPAALEGTVLATDLPSCGSHQKQFQAIPDFAKVIEIRNKRYFNAKGLLLRWKLVQPQTEQCPGKGRSPADHHQVTVRSHEHGQHRTGRLVVPLRPLARRQGQPRKPGGFPRRSATTPAVVRRFVRQSDMKRKIDAIGYIHRLPQGHTTNGSAVTPVVNPQGGLVPAGLGGPGKMQPQLRVKARRAPIGRARLRHGLDLPPAAVLRAVAGRFLTVRQPVAVVIEPVFAAALLTTCSTTVEVTLSASADALWRRRSVAGLSARAGGIIAVQKAVAVVVHLVSAVSFGLGANALGVVAVYRSVAVVVTTVGTVCSNLRDIITPTDDGRLCTSGQGLDR